MGVVMRAARRVVLRSRGIGRGGVGRGVSGGDGVGKVRGFRAGAGGGGHGEYTLSSTESHGMERFLPTPRPLGPASFRPAVGALNLPGRLPWPTQPYTIQWTDYATSREGKWAYQSTGFQLREGHGDSFARSPRSWTTPQPTSLFWGTIAAPPILTAYSPRARSRKCPCSMGF